jgi:hypothetical protein
LAADVHGDGGLATYAFEKAAADAVIFVGLDFFEVAGDELKFQGGAAGV